MMIIRRMKKDDLAQIADIYSYYVNNTVVSFDEVPLNVEQMKERIFSGSGFFPCLVCENEGDILGYIYAMPYAKKVAYQWDVESSIYLRPHMKNQGVGSTLYCCLKEILKLQGIVNVYASITASNKESLEFHKKNGFTQVACFPKNGYKSGQWHDVIWMHQQVNEYENDMKKPISVSTIEETMIDRIIRENSQIKKM